MIISLAPPRSGLKDLKTLPTICFIMKINSKDSKLILASMHPFFSFFEEETSKNPKKSKTASFWKDEMNAQKCSQRLVFENFIIRTKNYSGNLLLLRLKNSPDHYLLILFSCSQRSDQELEVLCKGISMHFSNLEDLSLCFNKYNN